MGRPDRDVERGVTLSGEMLEFTRRQVNGIDTRTVLQKKGHDVGAAEADRVDEWRYLGSVANGPHVIRVHATLEHTLDDAFDAPRAEVLKWRVAALEPVFEYDLLTRVLGSKYIYHVFECARREEQGEYTARG